MKRTPILTVMLTVSLCAGLLMSSSGILFAQPGGGHRDGHRGGPGFGQLLVQLTDEQREAVWELVADMCGQGTDRQEIHQAVMELLSEFGIELPDRPGGPDGPGGPRGPRHGRDGLGEDLTEQQRSTIRTRVFELWQAGAAHREIGAAVRELLEEYGIELPDRPGGGRGRGDGGHLSLCLLAQLSEEQRQQIHHMMRDMRRQGATPEEIRAAMEERFQQWGIELPEHGLPLTAEQHRIIRQVGYQMWMDGATREEIRSAVDEQIQSLGVQLPEGRRGHLPFGFFGFMHRCFMSSLSEEQRGAIRETRRDMRRQGATPEEVHEAVKGLLAGWGISPVDLSTELTAEQRAQLRAAGFELWMAGTCREDICRAVKELLGDFGIELPEGRGDIAPQGEVTGSPIVAQNYPNPANPETQISYTLGVSERVQIQIYNISGQLIRAYDMGHQSPGDYSVKWDGRHEDGQPVASGVYFYKVQAGPHSVKNRMVLLK